MKDEEDTSQTPTSEAPDGGYGWVIVACVFCITFLSFGTMYSIGILFDQLMADLACSSAEVSIMASLCFSLQCFLGPFASIVNDRYGTRITVFTGCLIISVSFISSAFAPHIIFLYFSFGILGGIGMALAFLPVIIIISYYFDKRRSLATALGAIGGFGGSFAHPYFIKLLESIYGWRGSLFILGGLVLNSLALSLLLRPPEGQTRKKAKTNESNQIMSNSSTTDSVGRLENLVAENMASANRRLSGLAEEAEEEGDNKETAETALISDSRNDLNQLEESFGTPPSELREAKPKTDSSPSSSMYKPRRDARRRLSERQAPSEKLTSPPVKRFISVPTGGRGGESGVENKISSQTTVPISAKSASMKRLPSRMNSFGGLYSPQVLQNQVSETLKVRSGRLELSRGLSLVVSERGDIEEEEEEAFEAEEIQKKGKTFGFFEVFKSVDYTALVLSNFLINMVFYTPSLFIADWGKSLNFPPEQTTILLSLVGIGNIFGRPAVAYLGDLVPNHRILLFIAFNAIPGVITTITPLFPNFPFLVFFVFQFAFLMGGGQALATPILGDLVPLDQLGHAFGVLIAVEGISILIGPPMLALFPTYEATFAATGVILFASAIVMAAIVYAGRFIRFVRRKPRRSTADGEMTEVSAVEAQ